MRRLGLLLLPALAVLVLAAAPAGACGGLVGENGTIQLTRTSTLAAHHNGIERYVTNFEFTGEGEEVGSIVPLPGVPTEVERGGDWTLQRLAEEVQPAVQERAVAFSTAANGADAEVILETKIDALDITVLRGGGKAVGRWAIDHGFLLTPDAPEVLDFYSRRSKVFMAARFDASRARELGQTARRRHPDHVDHPHRRAVGAVADPRTRAGQDGGGERRRVPPHRRAAHAALRRDGHADRAQRAGVEQPARRPALRQGHGVGTRRDVAHLPRGERTGARHSTTTSRCRRGPACCPTHGSPEPASERRATPLPSAHGCGRGDRGRSLRRWCAPPCSSPEGTQALPRRSCSGPGPRPCASTSSTAGSGPPACACGRTPRCASCW